MKTTKNTLLAGHIINYLMAAILIFSGALKLIGVEAYNTMIMELSPHYFENIKLIGVITMGSGLLFAIPKTFTWGFISTLVFLGGTISAHMQHGDNYMAQIVFVVLTGLVAYLKRPQWFSQQMNAVS